MHLLQASSRIVVACLVWTMLLGGTVSPLGYLAQAGQPPPDWEQSPPEEEPWAGVPGEESDKGVEFETPFIMGISSLAVEVTDCTTGAPIPAASLQAEFVFREGTEESYSPEDLLLIVVWAPGYFPQVVTEFSVVEIPMGFIALKIIVA
ncbi:MAG TPA: hypothetical protein ENI38_00015, partial [Candidatus Acetothermia bacterium]|nr:hypothetical protein [Candidatus Acetothermia bacterium]